MDERAVILSMEPAPERRANDDVLEEAIGTHGMRSATLLRDLQQYRTSDIILI